MKSICRFNHQPSDFGCFNNISYHSVPVDSSNLASTINTHLCEVTKYIPTLDQSRLDDLRNKLSPLPSQYTVEIEEVRSLLSKVKLNKSLEPDGISHKILKELASYLAPPVTSIINSSLYQGIVPDQWKISRITPVPKLFPPKHVESDVRPIAVINAIAKIAEKFVSRYFNDFYDAYTDVNQFGCVRGRSITHAVLKVMHELFILLLIVHKTLLEFYLLTSVKLLMLLTTMY